MALVKRLVSITVCKIYILDNYLQHEWSFFSPGILLFFTWNFPFFHLEFFFISPGIFLYFTWNFPFFHLEFSFFSPGIFFISPGNSRLFLTCNCIYFSLYHPGTSIDGGLRVFFLEKPSFLKSNFHVLEHENSYLPFIV